VRSRGNPMKIAKPLLVVMTPVGVAWGVVEAYRFGPPLAVLMTVLVAVVAAFFWMTVRVIRKEAGSDKREGTGSERRSVDGGQSEERDTEAAR